MRYTREFTSKAYADFLLLKQALIDAGNPEIDVNLRLDHIVRSASGGGTKDSVQLPNESNPVLRSRYEFFGYGIQCAVDHENQLVVIEHVLQKD